MSKAVLVHISSSVGIGGTYYHPNSKGVRMPLKHAKALGAEIIEEDKPETEDESESQKDEQEDEDVQKLPDDFPEKDRLLENGLDSVDKILAHPDLTGIKYIGKKTAEDILKAADELQQS